MADNTATDVTDAPDTGADESVDTSTNEETLETDDDTSLEDIEVSNDEIDDETEESEESEEEAPASDDSDDTEEESEEDDTSEDNTEDEVAERKRLNDEYAKQRIAEREAKRVEEQAREQAKAEAQMEYLKAAKDEQDLALRQLQVQAYNQQIEFNSNKLQTGLDKAVAVIPELREGSPEIQQFLIDAVDEFERIYVKKDQSGEPIEVNGDITDYLTKKADSARRLAGLGARTQAKAKSNAKARTLAPPNRAPKQPKTDSDLEDFDEGWN